MNASHSLNPIRAVPVVFALILNVVIGPLGPAIQSGLMGPTSALAYVGDATTFELDGNATTQSSHDWDQVYADKLAGNTATSGADNLVWVADTFGQGDDILTGGSTKDTQDLSSWLWKQSSTTSVQDKDDIENAFAAAYTASNGHTVGVFGLDRYSIAGDATAGFWFFKNAIAKTGNGSGNGTGFTGVHAEGDILVVIDFTNGGAQGTATVYKWHNGALTLDTSGTECDGSSQSACAITNLSEVASPWPYTPKSGTANKFPADDKGGAGALYEGGIDLTALGLDTGCFSSFLAETRSSQEPSSTLSDFVMGNFSFCETPNLGTQVSSGSIDMGDSVTDTATLSGNKGPVTGTVDFFVCGPNNSATACTSGGASAGANKAIVNGSASSDAVTPTQPGWYCFRAEYTPAQGSKYLATSHTNATTECFQAKPAVIHVTKTADAASVSAGEQIGFHVTISNSGSGTAKGLSFSDALPAGTGVDWSIESSDAGWSITGSPPNEHLVYSGTTMAAGASSTVHVVSATTKDSCKEYDNTASVSTTNDGSDEASAATTVLCPSIHVTKTADAASVSAGTQIGFHVTVSNSGQGKAFGVTLTDALPGGNGGTPVHWAIDGSTGNPASFAISGADGSQQLTLAGQPITMNAGASLTVHIVAATSSTSCAAYDNTASVTTTNDGSDQASASTEVLCPSIHIVKTADAASVSAGSPIGFSVTVSNTGEGNAAGVTLSDALPGGNAGSPVHWTIDGSTGNPASFSITGADGSQHLVLAGQPITLNAGASLTVHVVAATTGESCATYDNSASVTTTNDSSDQASAETEVLCPDVTVLKTADNGTISAGDTAAYTIVVSNIGAGVAKSVTLIDNVPAGVSWSEDSPDCTVNNTTHVLACSFGDLAPQASRTIHLSGVTDAADCGELPNTAVVAATNEASADTDNNESSALIVVECPDLQATKTADANPVNAGDPIGFTISVMNDGDGTAHGVVLNDPLPKGSGLDWSIADQPNGNPCSITGTVGGQTLVCSFGDLGSGQGVSVHVVSDTSKADCGTYHNVATVTASNNETLQPSADVTVQCPGLNISKVAADGSINGGDSASFTIVVWNAGPGTALNVHLDDPLPGGLAWTDDSASCDVVGGDLQCDFGDLGITTMQNSPARVTVTAPTTRQDCGTLNNVATASADNADSVQASASIDVTCPLIAITKSNDQPEPVLPGTEVTYTLKVSVSEGPATDVTVVDTLPAGLDDPTAISDGGTWTGADRTITWHFASLPNGDKFLSYKAAVSQTDENGDSLTNNVYVTGGNTQCPDSESLTDECQSTSNVTVRLPSLVIDKKADIDEVHFVFKADGSLKSVTPANRQVTWTLTYTLANGPVTNAVICDPLPAHLTFVSASDGGVLADGSGSCPAGNVEWDLGTLSSSGSVTFVTTVDLDAPDGPIDNVASIVSDQTPKDTGEDSIRVTSEQVQAATPTPSVPNTAMALGQNGAPIQIPVELLILFFIGSLGTLTFANVRAVRRRR